MQKPGPCNDPGHIIQFVLFISAKVFDWLCTIGFHSTFLNNATNVIGIYVIMNIGKVKV